jgi:putative tryptophan/tyrosine transport system substrate-binding protein
VTGITPYVAGLPAKQIELAREVVAYAAKVGILGNLSETKAPPQRQELEDAAKALGVAVFTSDVRSPEDVARAIGVLVNERVEVVIVLQTTMMLIQRQAIAAFMEVNRLPAVYGYREHVDEGGLISYGVDLRWYWHRLATYVQKILKGTAPSDLPVELPPRLQMVINLRLPELSG